MDPPSQNAQESRFGFDAFAAFVLALTATIGAYAPLYLARRDKIGGGDGRPVTLIIGNMFSAGVMVSAGFCHLLGEAVKDMPSHLLFPLAPFLCGLGFLSTLCADRAATLLAGGLNSGNSINGENRSLTASRSSSRQNYHRTNSKSNLNQHNSVEIVMAVDLVELATPRSTWVTRNGDEEEEASPLVAGNTETNSTATANGRHRMEVNNYKATQKKVSFLTAVLMAIALGFHSVLEGAALGAQSTLSNSLHIFIAIVSHKGLAAYALGSSIVETNAELRQFLSVIVPFVLASPIGIFLGYIISDLAQGTGAASISALASGTFLYVAFMEVIPRETSESSLMLVKLLVLLLGYSLMSLLAIWA